MSPDYLIIRNTHLLSRRQQNLYVVAESFATISHLNLWLFDFFLNSIISLLSTRQKFLIQQFQNWILIQNENKFVTTTWW